MLAASSSKGKIIRPLKDYHKWCIGDYNRLFLGADLGDSMKKIYDTQGYHAIFGVLERLYAHLLITIEEVDGDDEHVMEHRPYALRAYMLYMVDTSIF